MLRSLMALALLGAAPATYPVTDCYDGMPPPRFGFAPPKPMRISYGHLDKCGTPHIEGHPNAYFASCIRHGVTYLPDPCAYGAKEDFARLACHEAAHINGWPADHGA